MGEAFITRRGGGGGAAGLNFRIIGGTAEPSNPKENDIWINTENEITSWDFSAAEPCLRSTCKNLVVYPYYQTTHTASGITVTDNKDGTLKLSGTATANKYTTVRGADSELLLQPGTYTLSGCPAGGGEDTYCLILRTEDYSVNLREYGDGCTFTLDHEAKVFVIIGVISGVTVSNLVFKPQVEKGSAATAFVKGDATGQLWIRTGPATSAEFNALKKNEINIYPNKAVQYTNGEWVGKTAEIYQSGAWQDWLLYLYKDSAINNEIVGALTAYAYRPSTSGSTATAPTVAQNASGITLSLAADADGTAGSFFATRGIDLTNYKTLKIYVDTAAISTYSAYIRFGVTDERANNYEVAAATSILNAIGSVSAKTFSVDISDLTGTYYLFVNLYGTGKRTITFSKWWLEP